MNCLISSHVRAIRPNPVILLLTALLFISVSANVYGEKKAEDQLQEDFYIKPSKVNLGLNLIGGYIPGNRVSQRLDANERFLYGGGVYAEYRVSSVIRATGAIDALFAQFYDWGTLGRGWSYSAGIRLLHQPEARSSLTLSGSIGTVILGDGSRYQSRPYIDRSCWFGRLGIGHSYYVTKSNLTLVEFIFAGIKTSDGNNHPYVGITDQNVYYLLLRVSWLFGL